MPPDTRRPPPGVGAFVDAALRRVLEVIDCRRPVTQLEPLLAPELVDSIRAGRDAAVHRDVATLQRLRVRPAGSGESAHAVEAFGTYRRGTRLHALACRVERSGPEARWRIVALHIG